jgi:HrpA-like RNA helicase
LAGTWYEEGRHHDIHTSLLTILQALLPLDLRLGKVSQLRPAGWQDLIPVASQMLILATVFQCVDPVLTIAACLSSKPVFLNPMDKRDEASECDGLLPPHTHLV